MKVELFKKTFRVKVAKREGGSDPLATEGDGILTKNPYDLPGRTDKPEIVNFDEDHVDLKWKAPDDGGSPIQEYITEKRDRHGRWEEAMTLWILMGTGVLYKGYAVIREVLRDSRLPTIIARSTQVFGYATLQNANAVREDLSHYRFVVENDVDSDSSTISLSVADGPDPPRLPLVENALDEAAALSWKPPELDGGSLILK